MVKMWPVDQKKSDVLGHLRATLRHPGHLGLKCGPYMIWAPLASFVSQNHAKPCGPSSKLLKGILLRDDVVGHDAGILIHLVLTWADFGADSGHLGTSWGRLGTIRGLLAYVGVILAHLWGTLGSSGTILQES